MSVCKWCGCVALLEEVKEEWSEDGILSYFYFECLFLGGEGEMFHEDAVGNGNCGRSVGCFEVGLKKKKDTHGSILWRTSLRLP